MPEIRSDHCRMRISALHQPVLSGTLVAVLVTLLVSPTYGQDAREGMREHFKNPPIDCRPHTRWWWMGNAVTKDEITWELEEMFDKGMGGVEQITMQPVYEKGNIPYLSDEFLEMLQHTVQTAKRLGMNVSLNFGGPGWVLGGDWVPPEDRSKALVPTFADIDGPRLYSGPLPMKLREPTYSWQHRVGEVTEDDRLLGVAAGRVVDGQIDEDSLLVLTSQTQGTQLEWQVPEGRWRLAAFWLKRTGQGAVDHFNKGAMERYCQHLGGRLEAALGEEFGKTVDSLFCDSFEVSLLPDGFYWTDGLLEEFKTRKGYDLIPRLLAVWWDVGDISPKIRYDVNEFLHEIGLEAFFEPFLGWCEAHGIQGRIQPYGFATDNIQAAGITHIPEMEITAGEKDAVPWFDTRIGPKKYVSSGAHLYGRRIVTTEAYTYLHWQPYRATLEELKIATDIYFRTGANKIYNHGYNYSPERDVAPSRRMNAAICISHPNVWWNYYPRLAEYISRCCYLLRQGDAVADIAVYSPLANQWTLNVLNARRWTRDFDWGGLGKLLVANGYDFDLLNDDILQNHADVSDGEISIRNLRYGILILPNIESLPLRTLQVIQAFVRNGGVAIALERTPEYSVGLADYNGKDAQVKAIVRELFEQPRGRNGTGPKDYGNGRTYVIKQVIDRGNVLDWRSSALDPFVKTLRAHLAPDFGIDFAEEGLRENDGLTFAHRKLEGAELYFVTNVQDRPSDIPVTFRVHSAAPWEWNPYNGGISPIHEYRDSEDGIEIPLHLEPYESTFILFELGAEWDHVIESNLDEVLNVSSREVGGLAAENGEFYARVASNGRVMSGRTAIDDVPADYAIAGPWSLVLEGRDFPRIERSVEVLESWTEDNRTRHFSGTGRYETTFVIPSAYLDDDLSLQLDLGRVCEVAEVELNGISVGTRWMRGQVLDITGKLREGDNELVVLVTNTLINRVSGFKEPPPVPDALIPHFGSGTTSTSANLRGPIGFEPLPASGLLGPVKIRARKKIRIPLQPRSE